jgi:hypothetical protein
MTNLKYIIAIILLVNCITLCGCQDFKYSTSKGYYWTVIPGTDKYQTNDISKAQAESPFLIVVPSYLPDELDRTPYSIRGDLKKAQEQQASINISYQGSVHNSYKNIRISESQTSYYVNSPTEYITIGGIKVFIQSSVTVGLAGTQVISVPSTILFWNKDGVDFTVTVDEYSRDEAIKIVESMFS